MAELPDARLVQVFRTDDPALLPLATMALEGEGIEYQRAQRRQRGLLRVADVADTHHAAGRRRDRRRE